MRPFLCEENFSRARRPTHVKSKGTVRFGSLILFFRGGTRDEEYNMTHGREH